MEICVQYGAVLANLLSGNNLKIEHKLTKLIVDLLKEAYKAGRCDSQDGKSENTTQYPLTD